MKKVTVLEIDSVLLRGIEQGTAGSTGYARLALAMFSNGVRLALGNPVLAERLSSSAETLTRGKPFTTEETAAMVSRTTLIDKSVDDLR